MLDAAQTSLASNSKTDFKQLQRLTSCELRYAGRKRVYLSAGNLKQTLLQKYTKISVETIFHSVC